MNRRPILFSVGMAVIVGAGTITGAMLKSNEQAQQKQQELTEETIDEKIKRLELYRQTLYQKRDEMERKLREVNKKMEAEASSKTTKS